MTTPQMRPSVVIVSRTVLVALIVFGSEFNGEFITSIAFGGQESGQEVAVNTDPRSRVNQFFTCVEEADFQAAIRMIKEAEGRNEMQQIMRQVSAAIEAGVYSVSTLTQRTDDTCAVVLIKKACEKSVRAISRGLIGAASG